MTILTSFCQYVDDQNNRYECCQTHNDNNEPAPDWKKNENMKVYFKINAIWSLVSHSNFYIYLSSLN